MRACSKLDTTDALVTEDALVADAPGCEERVMHTGTHNRCGAALTASASLQLSLPCIRTCTAT